jgi:CBS domain-containing protein
MGFEQVYDYAAGKADWGSFGLPLDGEQGSESRVAARMRSDVPTCRLDEPVQDVRRRLDASGWDTCVVVNDERVVLGRIDGSALGAGEPATAEEAMAPGPSTIRPSARPEKIARRMRLQDLADLLVTTPDGRLLGIVSRGDVEGPGGEAGVTEAPPSP